MTTIDTPWPGTQTVTVGPYVMSLVCCLSSSGKWWGIAALAFASSRGEEAMSFRCRIPEDNPDDAMAQADLAARDWIRHQH